MRNPCEMFCASRNFTRGLNWSIFLVCIVSTRQDISLKCTKLGFIIFVIEYFNCTLMIFLSIVIRKGCLMHGTFQRKTIWLFLESHKLTRGWTCSISRRLSCSKNHATLHEAKPGPCFLPYTVDTGLCKCTFVNDDFLVFKVYMYAWYACTFLSFLYIPWKKKTEGNFRQIGCGEKNFANLKTALTSERRNRKIEGLRKRAIKLATVSSNYGQYTTEPWCSIKRSRKIMRTASALVM